LLHGLTGGDGAEGIHITFLGAAIHFFPQHLGAALGEGVLGLKAATQADHVGRGVAALDAFPTGILGPVFFEGGDLLFAGHGHDASL